MTTKEKIIVEFGWDEEKRKRLEGLLDLLELEAEKRQLEKDREMSLEIVADVFSKARKHELE